MCNNYVYWVNVALFTDLPLMDAIGVTRGKPGVEASTSVLRFMLRLNM